MSYRKTWLEVNLSNLEFNYNFLKDYTNKDVIAVVKANGYGLGIVEVASTLKNCGCNYFAVSSIEEALVLRNNNFQNPIIVFGATSLSALDIVKKHDLTLTVTSLDWAQELNNTSFHDIKLHIKIDTGMNRHGFKETNDVIDALTLLKNRHQIEGIYTHYYEGVDFDKTVKQFNRFKEIVEKLDFSFKYIHASNSDGIFTLKEDFTNTIRPGIALYGYIKNKGLKETLKLYTTISHVKAVKEHETIGYDGIYTAHANELNATLPIGYADGYNRSLSGFHTFIESDCIITGRICMDQMMINIPHHYPIGTTVELIGDNVSIYELCEYTNQIPYEILVQLSSRITRIYINN